MEIILISAWWFQIIAWIIYKHINILFIVRNTVFFLISFFSILLNLFLFLITSLSFSRSFSLSLHFYLSFTLSLFFTHSLYPSHSIVSFSLFACSSLSLILDQFYPPWRCYRRWCGEKISYCLTLSDIISSNTKFPLWLLIEINRVLLAHE